jgi:hypothetical protein
VASLLIRGGRNVSPEDRLGGELDLLIEGGAKVRLTTVEAGQNGRVRALIGVNLRVASCWQFGMMKNRGGAN